MKTLRFSENELTKIEQYLKVHNLKFASFARAKILDYEIKSSIKIEEITQLQKLNSNLLALGNNLNQIAKIVNQNDDENKIDLLEKLAEIEKELKAIVVAS